MSKKFLVLVNASAGTAKARGQRDLSSVLAAAFSARESDAEIRFLPAADFRKEIMEAREATFDGIIVGGGDGTIRTAASVLAGSKIPLGVLPLGTLNHFAKDLGIPLAPEDAIGIATEGNVARIDLGVVNDEIFINNSSIGIYPFLVLDRERMQEDEGKRKWHAALLAAIRALRKFPLRKLRVRVGAETVLHKSPVVFIGNNSYGLEPGKLGKRERMDEGELSVHVAKVGSRMGFAMLLLRGMLGLLRGSRDLKILRGVSAEVISKTSRLPVALDGEVEILVPPLRYSVRRRALQVFVPSERK